MKKISVKEQPIDIVARNLNDLKSSVKYVIEHMATKEDIKKIDTRLFHVEQQNEYIMTSVELIEKGSVPDLQKRIKKLEHSVFKTP